MTPLHPDRQKLSEFAAGRLDETEVRTVEEHLAACDTCVEVIDGLHSTEKEQPDDPLQARLRTQNADPVLLEPPVRDWIERVKDHPPYDGLPASASSREQATDLAWSELLKILGPPMAPGELGTLGRRPFTGSMAEVLGKILHVEPDPPSKIQSGVDPALEAICLKTMAKNPAERYASMRHLAEALNEFLKAPAVGQAYSLAGSPKPASESARTTAPAGEHGNFTALMAVLAEERKAEAAQRRVEIEAAVRKARIPLWQWLTGAVFLAAVLLGGIIFFVRTPMATVIINVDVDLSDITLSFFLDGKAISAERLGNPVELKVGEHELLVKRGDTLVKRMHFTVRGGRNPGIEFTDIATTDAEMTNSIGMKLVLIPAGKFLMGSPDDEPGRDGNEGPQHEVTITKPFYIGRYEITVGQFREFVRATGHQTEAEKDGAGAIRPGAGLEPNLTWQTPGWNQTDDAPVACISFNDAEAFCRWLTAKEKRHYRLPTEAEWEYACRAGSRSAYFFGETESELGRFAWHAGNSGGRPHSVGQLAPNAWGLYDILGNLIEMCADDFAPDYYSRSAAEDPIGPQPRTRANRIGRGAAWFNAPDSWFRSAFRWAVHPDSSHRSTALGFRVVGERTDRPADPNYCVAKWVLQLKGSLGVQVDGQEQRVAAPAELPGGAFEVLVIQLPGSADPAIDKGLQQLQGLKSLDTLNLGQTQVTDAGLESLQGMKKLRVLWLQKTPVTGSGFAHIRDLSQLEQLVTGSGLMHIRDCVSSNIWNLGEPPSITRDWSISKTCRASTRSR